MPDSPFYYWLIVPRGVIPTIAINGITPNNGPDSGGTPLSIDGTGFEVGAVVRVNGKLATSIVWHSSILITCVTPPSAFDGFAQVVVTNPSQTTSGGSGYNLFTYNPVGASLHFSFWYKPPYVGAPWAPNASAGPSFANGPAVAGSLPPDPGVPQNTFVPANFDANQGQTLMLSATNAVLFGGDLSYFCVFKTKSVPVTTGTPYADGTLFTDHANAETTFGVTDLGFGACILDNTVTYQRISVPIPGPPNADYHVGSVRLTGGLLYARVDSGPWSAVPCGPYTPINPSVPTLGSTYLSAFFDGAVEETAGSDIALSFADCNAYLNSLIAKYALPYGPPLNPPVVTSITPNNGSDAGGTPITDLHGTDFVTGCTVTIGGTPATAVVFVSSTQLTCDTPAGADGAADVIVTNPDLQDSGTSGNGLFTFNASVLNLATLTLTQYYDSADYAYTSLHVSSWGGRASAGLNPQEITNQAAYVLINPAGGTAIAPTVGPLLNGHPTVLYSRGLSEYLVSTVPLFPNPFAPEAGGSPAQQKSFWFVFNYDGLGAGNAPNAAYDNSALLSDFGQNKINIAFRSGKAQVCIFDGGFKGVEVAYTNNTWAIGMVLVDGVNASIRIGSGAFTTTPCGFLASPSGPVNYGRSSNPPGALYGGGLANFGMADLLWDAPTCAAIYASLSNRYGIP
jgi:hypothetical protein